MKHHLVLPPFSILIEEPLTATESTVVNTTSFVHSQWRRRRFVIYATVPVLNGSTNPLQIGSFAEGPDTAAFWVLAPTYKRVLQTEQGTARAAKGKTNPQIWPACLSWDLSAAAFP